MTINKTALKAKLATVIDDYINGSVTTDSVVSLALSINAMNEPNIVTVESADYLPNLELYDSPNALICFINNLDVFVISSNKKWLTLDGRLVRDFTNKSVGVIYGVGNQSVAGGDWGTLADGGPANTNRSSPVSVVGNFNDWDKVSPGRYHTVGLRTNGTLWAWGSESLGRLGNNETTSNRSSPVSVIGGFTDWCQVSAGSDHTMAIRSNGTLWGWGSGGNGRLGNDLACAISSPVSVVGGFTDWCWISAGEETSHGIRTNGTLWSWGGSFYGNLGNNTTTCVSSPVSVVGGFTDWTKVSGGFRHTVALRSNGTLWSWGNGTCGALGNNCTTNRSSPVSVVGGFTDWCQVSTGRSFTLAVRTNGSAWAWGLATTGQLGDNTTTPRSSPVSVIGGFTDWCQVSAGCYHSVGIRTNGTVWAWGRNSYGQLGNNSTTSTRSPVSIVGGITTWAEIGTHALANRSFFISKK